LTLGLGLGHNLCVNGFDASVLNRTGTVFIDDRDIWKHSGHTFLFTEPLEVLVANTPDELPLLLCQIDERLKCGRFLAGYLSYSAGHSLDKPIPSNHTPAKPLAWFGVYADRAMFDSESVNLPAGSPSDIADLRLNISTDEYLVAVEAIKGYIRAGDIYQANFTCKLLFRHMKSAGLLFGRLRDAHPVGYSAFINTGETQIISISPELFLRRSGNSILTRPMKGTSRRGLWYEDDVRIAQDLASDAKNRAENVMILDLMRNDLGRVCDSGSVSVPRLFHIERYDSLFQMTSDAEGVLREGTSVSELIRAAFPPGSVTGAPKIRAMEIIDELEHEDRGVYCGCVGMFEPNGDCLLNVAIRTIVQRGNECEMGVGSGIVADSVPEAELNEVMLKGDFLHAEEKRFRLLETMLYNVGVGYAYLDQHLIRMRNSAEYFGRRFAESQIREILDIMATELESSAADKLTDGSARVRVLLDADGAFETEWTDAGFAANSPVRILLASRRTDPSDAFLYHKTTRREGYDSDLREARVQGFFDLIYLNTRGELTEGAITNVNLRIAGEWYTPALSCGLLPGIWRRNLLDAGETVERVITIDDLRRCDRIQIGNSVRGAMDVDIIQDTLGNIVYRG